MFRKLKYLILILVFSAKLNSQTIAPIIYTVTGSAPSNTHFNACVEDSANNKLYLQSSCICGVGPGNVYTGFCYANILTNIIGPTYVGYGIYGTEWITKKMHYSNNALYVNDGNNFSRYNLPSYGSAWTYSPSSSQTVVASAMRNDSVFTITDDGGTCQILEIRNRNTGALITWNTIDCSGSLKGSVYGDVAVMKLLGNKLYLAGYFQALDASFNPVDDNMVTIDITNGNMIPLNFQVNDSIKDMKLYNGKIHISGNFTSVKGQPRNHYAVLDLAGILQSGTPSFNDYVEKIEVYDHYLLACGKFTMINSTPVNPSVEYIIKGIDLNTNTLMNWNMPFTIPISTGPDLMMESSRNRLFAANSNFGGMYLDGFCLPPIRKATSISTATNAFCVPSSNATFSVSAFLYASAYTWSYTGTGATVTNTNNIANVNFSSGATSGKLKVWTQSICGSVSDTLSMNITIYPQPNVNASLVDDTLNCFKPKVPILGNSSTPFASFAWGGPSGYTSAQQNDSTGTFLPGVYTLTVTAPITGCKNTASVVVRIDTVRPNVTLPPGPYLVGCGSGSLTTLNGTSTTTPTTLWWKKSSSSTYTANPATVSLGSYSLEVRNTYNGCINTSSLINVTSSAAQPTVMLTSHTFSNSTIPVDTITCITSSVTLVASFSPTNCTAVWRDVSTQTLSSNPVTVYGNSNQKLIVTRLDNSCVDSSMIVLVTQDITKPNILILTPNPNINCSSSTATLNAVFSPTSGTGVWTGPSSFSSSNPAITNTQGKYYFAVTRSDNGCSKKDSVNVGYSNTLVVNACKDTTVCKSSQVTLSAVVAGTVSGVTYTWSSGGSGQFISVNPALTTTYIVTANGSLGCTGKDTVVVNIPADMQDSIVTAKGCTGNNGSLTIYVKGGISPYKYSVNGSPFTTQITYTNLPFATYNVSIKDSIGCVLNTSAAISQNSNLNQPVFIVSTQNFKGDTVVFIDLTTPRGDSVKWVLPTIASIVGGDMFSPIVVFADTGSFPVTEQVFYGTCMTSLTKTIRILPLDSAYATLTNNNGIKVLNLFPNPNNGQFTVQIEFYKKQNASVQIWDSQPQRHFQQNFSDADIINLPIDVSFLQNGTYVLRVTGEYASRHFYFVIGQ
jgi:hypothetical protein